MPTRWVTLSLQGEREAAQMRPLMPVLYRGNLDAQAFLIRGHKYLSKLRHQLTLAIKMGC
jgi:hypothetical protein